MNIVWQESKRERKGQSTERNYENGSTMNQKEVIKWSVYLETIEKCYRDLLWQSHKGEQRNCYWGFTYRQLRYLYMESVWHTQKKAVKFNIESKSKMCNSLNNLISKMGYQIIKRKQYSGYPHETKKMLHKPCVTVTHNELNNSTDKISET